MCCIGLLLDKFVTHLCGPAHLPRSGVLVPSQHELWTAQEDRKPTANRTTEKYSNSKTPAKQVKTGKTKRAHTPLFFSNNVAGKVVCEEPPCHNAMVGGAKLCWSHRASQANLGPSQQEVWPGCEKRFFAFQCLPRILGVDNGKVEQWALAFTQTVGGITGRRSSTQKSVCSLAYGRHNVLPTWKLYVQFPLYLVGPNKDTDYNEDVVQAHKK